MKILVAGSGRMGIAAAWALHKLGHEVVLYDKSYNQQKKAKAFLDKLGVKLECISPTNQEMDFVKFPMLSNIDSRLYQACLSTAPYEANPDIATTCIENDTPYFDLGGHIETSNKIHGFANANKSPVFTDLGLAPGFVNILAEHMVYSSTKKEVPHRVEMYVGGLPYYGEAGSCRPSGDYLGYACTWSVDGLVNEYTDDCQILKDGNIVTIPALDNGYVVEQELDGRVFIAFPTSGGAAHTLQALQSLGVQDASYRTLRYYGTFTNLKFLTDIGLDRETLKKVLETACPPTTEDVVYIKVKMSGYTPLELVIKHDKVFTAMQKATAFPAAVAIDKVLKNVPHGKYVYTYSDVARDGFQEKVADLLKEADNVLQSP